MSIWSILQVKFVVSLIFCLDNLCIAKNWCWGITVLESIFFFSSNNICFVYVGAPALNAYIFTIIILFCWFDPFIIISDVLSLYTLYVLKSILSDTCIATSTLFWFPFAWIFFYIDSISVHLCIFRWSGFLVGNKEHKVKSYFLIH